MLPDAKRWRHRAEELRTIADSMKDAGARRTALQIAHGYDLLAERAEARGASSNLELLAAAIRNEGARVIDQARHVAELKAAGQDCTQARIILAELEARLNDMRAKRQLLLEQRELNMADQSA